MFRQRAMAIRYYKGATTGPHHDVRNYMIEQEWDGNPELKLYSAQEGWAIARHGQHIQSTTVGTAAITDPESIDQGIRVRSFATQSRSLLELFDRRLSIAHQVLPHISFFVLLGLRNEIYKGAIKSCVNEADASIHFRSSF